MLLLYLRFSSLQYYYRVYFIGFVLQLKKMTIAKTATKLTLFLFRIKFFFGSRKVTIYLVYSKQLIFISIFFIICFNLSLHNLVLDELEKKSQDLGSSENNRYNHILTSPTIVSFGQYRLYEAMLMKTNHLRNILFNYREQEGNYAPEEKYGFTERRSIRSSIDSDNITSPTRESNFAPTDSVDLGDVREHKIDHESYLPGTSSEFLLRLIMSCDRNLLWQSYNKRLSGLRT